MIRASVSILFNVYITMAAVAFDGICRHYFLSEDIIMVVPRAGNEMHLNMQIALLNTSSSEIKKSWKLVKLMIILCTSSKAIIIKAVQVVLSLIKLGDLYQATKQKVERLRQNGYKVVEMW